MSRSKEMAGFTLIELMVTIAVLAILISIAAPSMSDFVTRQRIGSQATELLSTLAAARAEATKRNANIVVLPASSGANGWVSGWCFGPASITNCQDTSTIQHYDAMSGVEISSDYQLSANKLTFRRDGSLLSGLSARPFKVNAPSSSSVTDARCIDINAVGRATVRSVARDTSC
ncbi:GspH/FimT family pseudopilin [Pseudomonas knackmussii]|uniref:GspH/FimT family pseudopilin n=1 Tax=Pseudomonas knackmussii TaxID=65741 RepID=UPI0013644AE9|nr:GspH/FimT family pseudopilin [Pseudomonas knackmussii]